MKQYYLLFKERLLERSNHYADDFYKDSDSKLFIKALSNFVQLAYPGVGLTFDEKMFADKKLFRKNVQEVIKAILDLQSRVVVKTYTTGQLSKFFGVSIMTINNWIENKRFIGVERKVKNQKIKISDNVLWISDNSELVSVRAMAEVWEEEQKKYTTPSDDEVLAALNQAIKFFENKYGGPYEDTLKKIDIKNAEQSRDEVEWKYLLERVKNA